jgi:hypothetical protein
MELDPATPWTNAMDSIFHSHHGFDILPFLPVFAGWKIPGGNDLRINITNMWVNRLTGDMGLPPEERFCKTNHPFILKDNWVGGGDETYHLQKAGLLGPVKLTYAKKK